MIEIRVITYKRPKLLERALRSLIVQTHTDWRAVVFDDSSDFESQAVVASLDDSRIEARCNPCNLGMVLNLSQAFSAKAFFPISTHACILEDDNAFEPGWLAENLKVISRIKHAVMVRNYHVVDVMNDGSFTPNPEEPMRHLYGDSAREIPFDERIKEAFFNFTLGTSCYFWKLNAGVDLSYPGERLHGPVMEAGRALTFKQPCWYEPHPHSLFSRFINKNQTPRTETPASTRQRRLAKVSEFEFTKHLCRAWKIEFKRSMNEIIESAMIRKRTEGLDALQRLAEAGCWQAWQHLPNNRCRIAAAKALAVGLLYRRSWSAFNEKALVHS